MSNQIPLFLPSCDIEKALKTSFETVNEAALTSVQHEREVANDWETSQPKWKRLMDINDPSLIWKSINWKGEICDKEAEKPSDEQFNVHFENLLNFNTDNHPEPTLNDAPYIPLLDDPFTLLEIETVIKDMKVGKVTQESAQVSLDSYQSHG